MVKWGHFPDIVWCLVVCFNVCGLATSKDVARPQDVYGLLPVVLIVMFLSNPTNVKH